MECHFAISEDSCPDLVHADLIDTTEVLTLAHLFDSVFNTRVSRLSQISIVLDGVIDSHSEVHRS